MQVLPIVVTPYRFSDKRSFWSYCGPAIVMRSSSDWVRTQDGSWARAMTQQTRGLNRNYNRVLKYIFKGAATTVIGRSKDGPLYRHYRMPLDGGTKPNLARLTIARQIEGWFLPLSRERQGLDVDRDAMETLTGDHLKSRHPWISPPISWVFLRRRIADQLFRPTGADD